MFSSFSRQRSAQTTIPCKKCESPLLAMRTCHEAYLRCPKCAHQTSIQENIQHMDKALEDFLEAINCDRV